MVKHLIIDTDTCSDEAVALVMALRHPGVVVEAITTVYGGVPLDLAVQNALYTAELCGVSVPVYVGCAQPVLRAYKPGGGQAVHGMDGMGDIGLPLGGRRPAPGHAVDALIEAIHHHAGEVILVTLGPLTNLAVALLRDPSIAGEVRECVVMGGVGIGPGNVTPVAEANVWGDPEAAQIVFQSGMPLTMVGIDVNNRAAVFDPPDAVALRAIGTPLAHFCVDIQGPVMAFMESRLGRRMFSLPDPIAMAVALNPAVATVVKPCYVSVDLSDGLTRGQTIVDHLEVTGRPANVKVVLDASREAFVSMLYSAVR
ncbi:MAG: nucleoside hydrolase [Anaerolineae bacterium]|nr:nucleoside hydrolase [Anaerolineae bacterium]